MDLRLNYYEHLNLETTASLSAVKKRYRILALKFHPDKNPDDPNAQDKFHIIHEAYKILGDVNNKERYDKQSTYGKDYKPYKYEYKGFSQNTGYEENLNINIEVSIKLNDIYQNKTKQYKYKRNKICSNCSGTGFEPNDNWSECLFCVGTGKNDGVNCKYCKGTGKLYRNMCQTCDGKKVLLEEETLTLNNIHTVTENKTVRYKDYGHQSQYFEDKCGELIVFIKIKQNVYFSRKVHDLYVEERVHFADLITGNKLYIDLPDESTYVVNIPEKSTPGQIFRIKDKGFLKKNKQRGNLLIKVNIMIDYDKISKELIYFLNGENKEINSENNNEES